MGDVLMLTAFVQLTDIVLTVMDASPGANFQESAISHSSTLGQVHTALMTVEHPAEDGTVTTEVVQREMAVINLLLVWNGLGFLSASKYAITESFCRPITCEIYF